MASGPRGACTPSLSPWFHARLWAWNLSGSWRCNGPKDSRDDIQVTTMKSNVVQYKSIKWASLVLGALPRHSQAGNLGRQSSGGDRQRLHDLMAVCASRSPISLVDWVSAVWRAQPRVIVCDSTHPQKCQRRHPPTRTSHSKMGKQRRALSLSLSFSLPHSRFLSPVNCARCAFFFTAVTGIGFTR